MSEQNSSINRPAVTRRAGIVLDIEDITYDSKSTGKAEEAIRIAIGSSFEDEGVEYIGSRSAIYETTTTQVKDKDGNLVDQEAEVQVINVGDTALLTLSHRKAGETQYVVSEGKDKGKTKFHAKTGTSCIKAKPLPESVFEKMLKVSQAQG